MYSYSLIIADDNISTANGLHDMICAEFPNIHIISVCSNGEQVIELLQKNAVDILILDVQMPAKTGIDVLRYIYENKRNTKTILITGYTKFEYALDAIKYKVSNLIPKPINNKLMIQSIQDIIRSIEMDVSSAHMQTNNILKAYKLLKNNVKMVYYGYKIQDDNMLFGDLDGDPPIGERQSVLVEFVFNFNNNSGINTFGIWSDLFDDVNDSMDSFCVYEEAELAKVFIISKLNHTVKFNAAVKKYIDDCVQLAKSIYNLDCKVNFLWQGAFGDYNAHPDFEKLVHIYCKYLDTSNMIAKNDFIDLIRTTTFSTAQNFALDLLNYTVPETNGSFSKIKKEILRAGNQSEVLDAISEIEEAYFMEKQNGKDIICAIKGYIINHYDRDMTLNSIASEFNISPYYLSKLFKQKSSQGFSDYVVFVKMNKAKELLANNEYSISTVASMVGYSTDYFRKIFKEQVGISPGQYAKMGLKNRL